MAGAERILAADGVLYLYGPFKENGQHTAPSNACFDASLRQRNPEWGVRDVDDVCALAHRHGLALVERVAMPANNLSLVFRSAFGVSKRRMPWIDPFSRQAWDRNAATYEIDPADAFQRRARRRHAERGAFQALHHARRALPHRLRSGPGAGCREGAQSRPHRAIRQGAPKKRSSSSGRCMIPFSANTRSRPQALPTPRCRRRVTITSRSCSPPRMPSPTKSYWGRCCLASGSMRRSGATSMRAPRRCIPIGPGSTPMRARNSTPPCAP